MITTDLKITITNYPGIPACCIEIMKDEQHHPFYFDNWIASWFLFILFAAVELLIIKNQLPRLAGIYFFKIFGRKA